MGHKVNRKRVQRLMQLTGIQALYPKPRTSIKNTAHAIYPYLLKDLQIDRPNQAWQVDITYLKLRSGFMYLVALIDAHSRYVVSWELSNTLDTEFCLMALESGFRVALPSIVNSDQGCQFTSEAWISALKTSSVQVSMTGKGRCHDNIYIERFWRSFKYEDVYLSDYCSVEELRLGIKNYVEFYNHKRWHQSLGYRTPADVYFCRAQEPMDMLDSANALPTYPQAQQQRGCCKNIEDVMIGTIIEQEA